MGALLGLAGAVLIGHIALGTAIGSLTVPAWIELGGGVVSLIKLDAATIKRLQTRSSGMGHPAIQVKNLPQHPAPDPARGVCFQGAPSAQAARFCP